MNADHYADLLSAGPAFAAEEVPVFMRSFRPRLAPAARAARSALRRMELEALLGRMREMGST